VKTAWLTLPNFLGGLRFIIAFILLAIAWWELKTLFIALLIFAFLLDAIDGPIARHLGQCSEQGSRLDTVADFSVYSALVIGVWLLWPVIFYREMIFISLAVMSMLLPFVVALIKFRTFTSYHTWLVKVATVLIAVGSIILVAGGPALPFRLACIVSMLGGFEQILITLLLPQPRPDVQHIYAVLKSERQHARQADTIDRG